MIYNIYFFLEKKIEERKQANAELIEKIRRLQAKQIETMGMLNLKWSKNV